MMPVLAYYPGVPMPEFCKKINGEWSDAANPVELEGQQYCNTVEVEIMILGAVDVYAYYFKVIWDGTDYIELVDSEVKDIHDGYFWVIHTDDGVGFYEQAVTAYDPGVGANGDVTVANLYFHIMNDAQWPDSVTIQICFEETEMSDSCTEPIDHAAQEGYLKLIPVQPVIKLLPPVTVVSVVGETFTVQIEIQNIIKMKSFHFRISWCPDQLTTDAQNVWIKDFLPPPYEYVLIEFGDHWLDVDVWMPCEKPPINGTGELMGITFKAIAPWGYVVGEDYKRPTIPVYCEEEIEDDHNVWYPDVCWNFISIKGYIDKGCGEGTHYQDLGTDIKVRSPFFDEDTEKWVFNWNDPAGPGDMFAMGYYEFRPIPGDLNLDGHCDIEDLSAICKAYGKALPDPEYNDFDLDSDGDIDIFDIVIVAKNICRTLPDPEYPWDIPVDYLPAPAVWPAP